jgi:hypothetical protein
MKKIIFTLVVVIGLLSLNNLSAQHPEAHKLDKQIGLTMDTATHHMMLFILKQDTTEYNTSLSKVAKAKELTKEYKTMIAKEKGISGKTDAEEAAYLVEEINMYAKPKLKETVMADKKKTEKYKYQGQTYTVGTKSKALLDEFAEYL